MLRSDVAIRDVEQGKFDVIFCHPEALFSTVQGQQLLSSKLFKENVMATVVDECHKVDDW